MPVPRHFKVTFRGIFKNSREIWSHSHRLKMPTLLGVDLENSVGDLNLTVLGTAWQAMATVCCHADALLTDIRAYSINTDGRMHGNPSIKTYATGAELKGTKTTVRYPPQVALAVTTEAPNRGPGRFGRFYLPAPPYVLDSAWVMEANDQNITNTAARTFLLALRDAYTVAGAPDTVDTNPINVSTLGNNGQGTVQTITAVRCGRVLDTQRRRRNAIDELYRTLAL